jgi:hypothetical protein
MRRREFIRFSRRFESSKIRGYALEVGPQFFLLALVSDRLWFDGFECFCVKDVKDLRPDPYAPFCRGRFEKNGEHRPKKPRVSVARYIANRSIRTCAESGVFKQNHLRVTLLEMSPDAVGITPSRLPN